MRSKPPEVLGPRYENALRQKNNIERQIRKVRLERCLNPRVIYHYNLFKLWNPCVAQARQQREQLLRTLVRRNDNRNCLGHYDEHLHRNGARDSRILEGRRVNSGMSWT